MTLETHLHPIERQQVLIPTRDGTRLSASIHWPSCDVEHAGPYPVLVEYHPYRIDDRSFSRVADHDYFARRGYVSVRLEVRGTGSSEGLNTDEYMAVETSDGFDVIEWIASQTWCSGAIGMFGSSYGGFTSLQVAMLQPPHLKAIVPMYATDDRYTDDCHYKGGALRAFYDVGAYGTSMVALNALPPSSDLWGARMDSMWQERLAFNSPYMLNWLANQCDGPYWRGGSLRGKYDKIKAATFMIGGWQDGYANPLFRTHSALRCPKKLLVGPWNHARPSVAVPGPRIDYRREIARWFDLHLRDLDDGISTEPPVTIFVQSYDLPDPGRQVTTGNWRSEPKWPPKQGADRVLYLSGDPCEGSGFLSPVRGPDKVASLNYDPTVGIAGGLWSAGVPFGLSDDQRRDEARSIVYTSSPLRKPLTMLGSGSVRLFASSTASVAVFVAKVADVAPGGSSALVTRGLMNGTRRDSLERPKPMEPGKEYELNVQLDATAWRFETGHRIRLAISGADLPNSWPTPERAVLSVSYGRSKLSCLSLPIVPNVGVKPPDFAPPPTTDGTDKEPHEWSYTEEPMTGRVKLEFRYGGWSAAEHDGRIYSRNELTLLANRWHPADVQVDGQVVDRIERNGGTLESVAKQQIRSDADSFHLKIERTITVDGREKDHRKWKKVFPRQLL